MCINICSGGCCNCRIPFHIYTPGQADKGKGKELGIVEKQWRGLGTEMFSDADTFTINFPKDADPDSKARILGFAFLLNMMEFEKDRFDFWNRRSFDARIYCVLLNMSNCIFQLGAIVSPVTP